MTRTARLLALLATLALAGATTHTASGRSLPGAPDSPSCLRGSWVATTAESQRVLKSLVPGPYTFQAKLYMIFQDGNFQYGTTKFVFRTDVATAVGRFFTLHPYTARRGAVTLGRGESTIEYIRFTAGGHDAPVPPPQTTAVPGGGPTPFQCRGNTLRYKLPRRSSLGWITLHRGRVASG